MMGRPYISLGRRPKNLFLPRRMELIKVPLKRHHRRFAFLAWVCLKGDSTTKVFP